ncbi:MAG TPA: phosphohistidine phosphatase SixA [Bacteroidetes bacterium]|nr:phosphohistidine phosphatase SixA [Bacteroidota bacterium]
MNLYLLRHGEALSGAQYPDSERPLSNHGLQQAAAVGRFFRDRGIRFDHIFCSPLLRARQTAETLMLESGANPINTTDALVSSSDPHLILLELRPLDCEEILVVGHEPHLSRTVSLLLGLEDRSRVEMKTCSLACVATAAAPSPGRGMLRWLIPSNATLK